MPWPDPLVVGWDIGGAHVKACVLRHGEVLAVAQWPCPLWQGLEQLERTLALARARWPDLTRARHAVTMTGEMVDLFEHREDGVRRLVAVLGDALGATPAALRFYAGDAGWCDAASAAREWAQVASANWLARSRRIAITKAMPRGSRPSSTCIASRGGVRWRCGLSRSLLYVHCRFATV